MNPTHPQPADALREAIRAAIETVSDPGIYHEPCFVKERAEYQHAILTALHASGLLAPAKVDEARADEAPDVGRLEAAERELAFYKKAADSLDRLQATQKIEISLLIQRGLKTEELMNEVFDFIEGFEDGAPDASPRSIKANHILSNIRNLTTSQK